MMPFYMCNVYILAKKTTTTKNNNNNKKKNNKQTKQTPLPVFIIFIKKNAFIRKRIQIGTELIENNPFN